MKYLSTLFLLLFLILLLPIEDSLSQEQKKIGITKRSEMREILGDKIVREIILK